MKTYRTVQYTPNARRALAGDKPAFTDAPRKFSGGEPLSPWRQVVTLFASSVAGKVMRRARRNVAHLRDELMDEAIDAVGLWVAQRQTKAHALGLTFSVIDSLLARVTYSPDTQRPSLRFWPRSLWRAALRACDNLQHKLGKSDAQPASFFDVFSPDEHDAGLCAVIVNARCDVLKQRILERMESTTSNRARGAGRQHLLYVERLRAYGLAAISGATFDLAHALTFARTVKEDVIETLSIRTVGADGTPGRYAAHDGKGTAAGTRKAKREMDIAARSRLWDRARAFADYVGVPFNARENGFATLF